MLERIKPRTSLVKEILNRLPKRVWKSSTTTFLDPSVGSGQFVVEIEKRLRAHGHTDKNISKRVAGHERSQFLVNLATHMNKLVGQYTVKSYEEYLEMSPETKFDVIVGNPPFERSDTDAKRWTLWSEFVKKAFELADRVAMITPQSITGPGQFAMIKDKTTVIAVGEHVKKHFPDVGSSFAYFVAHNKRNPGNAKLITDSGEFDYDLKNADFLPMVTTEETLEQMNWLKQRNSRVWTRGELHTSNKSLFDDNGKYEVFHTNAQMLKTNVKNNNLSKIRGCVTLSGHPKFQVIRNAYCSQATMWTEFDTVKEAKKFANECNDEYIQKIMKNFKWSGWNSKEVIESL
jgi:hypothetical protein